ncbi:MAG: hydrogenase maturation protease [Caldiserica bacterium]|nr:hydrogenase maturation protease [Caldisericota bacterium]MDH7562056.1 hydrogenase maturation protease [Caldisericota bacterium]
MIERRGPLRSQKPRRKRRRTKGRLSDLEAILRKSPLVILGAGSTLRGDDGWAFYFLEKLKPLSPSGVHLLWGETTPENLIGRMERIKPLEVLVLDSGDFPGDPGEVGLFDPEDLLQEPFFSHRLPFKFLASEIEKRTGAGVHLLLMKPKNVEFSEELSPEVKKGMENLLQAFLSLWK